MRSSGIEQTDPPSSSRADAALVSDRSHGGCPARPLPCAWLVDSMVSYDSTKECGSERRSSSRLLPVPGHLAAICIPASTSRSCGVCQRCPRAGAPKELGGSVHRPGLGEVQARRLERRTFQPTYYRGGGGCISSIAWGRGGACPRDVGRGLPYRRPCLCLLMLSSGARGARRGGARARAMPCHAAHEHKNVFNYILINETFIYVFELELITEVNYSVFIIRSMECSRLFRKLWD
eukprot:SAG31_NODE_7017_length_1816_cov_1.220151_1_plen_235_part_00